MKAVWPESGVTLAGGMNTTRRSQSHGGTEEVDEREGRKDAESAEILLSVMFPA